MKHKLNIGSLMKTLKSDKKRRSLLEYTKSTHPDYLAGWVHEDICKKLEQFSLDVENKKSPRLILTLPPRTGKSMLAAERFPGWHLAKNPRHEVVVASYALKPARDRTTEARRVVLTEEVQALMPTLRLRKDTYAKVDWRLEQGGGVLAVGVTGALTGSGADVLIIDDPVKDWADAYSPTKREATWDWYTSVAYPRLSPGGGILIIMTRWHEDDLVGRVLDRTANEGWVVVNYPAIAQEDEEHRKEGEALHPARFDLKRLNQIRETISTKVWIALYLGMPSTPGGSVWVGSWFKHWTKRSVNSEQHAAGWKTLPKKFDRTIISWDFTFGSKSKKASYVVGHVFGQSGDDFYLIDEARGKWGFVASKAATLALAAKYPGSITLIEDKANGPAIIDDLRKKLKTIHPISPDGSKIARAHAAASSIELGHVFLPEVSEVPWVSEYLKEVGQFPEGANDDRVDASSQAIRFMSKNRASLVFARRK